MVWGTLSTFDNLATNAALQTVADVGEQNVWQSVDQLFRIHNELVTEQLALMCDTGTEQLDFFGGGSAMTMDPIDQFATTDVQKIAAGQTVGFPLRKYGRALGWTLEYFQNVTMDEFAKQIQAIFDADLVRLQTELRRALYTPTNYTFRDYLVRNLDLPVKALVNADSTVLPPGPNGEAFNAVTHTHYLAAAVLNNAALDGLITSILEHYGVGRVVVYINVAQVATIRALTGFNTILDARIIPSVTQQRAEGNLDQSNLSNRLIGIYDNNAGAAEIWVKPWILPSYLFGFNPDVAQPLRMRVRPGRGVLRLMADWEQYPMRARQYEREYGFGIRERINGAILYIGGGSYVTPTSF